MRRRSKKAFYSGGERKKAFYNGYYILAATPKGSTLTWLGPIVHPTSHLTYQSKTGANLSMLLPSQKERLRTALFVFVDSKYVWIYHIFYSMWNVYHYRIKS
jgi:hypothetical protein